ncbi:hypothetical protein LA5095_00959 [Roseibium album]|uniref:Uncharacterized protein n=1 Tax=Roseibium album TaxID=311410 RepID=A0A0M7AHD9_9HYPH|nr:hypothetical protein LA5094_03012 [Roseibium album]CTQ66796.1 hypothetical protein LA5095_00959 [Roseibium album]CTQ74565.1 hypothetical protein LA5096_04097 [Roseibium album]
MCNDPREVQRKPRILRNADGSGQTVMTCVSRSMELVVPGTTVGKRPIVRTANAEWLPTPSSLDRFWRKFSYSLRLPIGLVVFVALPIDHGRRLAAKG